MHTPLDTLGFEVLYMLLTITSLRLTAHAHVAYIIGSWARPRYNNRGERRDICAYCVCDSAVRLYLSTISVSRLSEVCGHHPQSRMRAARHNHKAVHALGVTITLSLYEGPRDEKRVLDLDGLSPTPSLIRLSRPTTRCELRTIAKIPLNTRVSNSAQSCV